MVCGNGPSSLSSFPSLSSSSSPSGSPFLFVSALPHAKYATYTVTKQTDRVIQLVGVNLAASSASDKYTLTWIPTEASGNIYQVSANYITFNGVPAGEDARGAAIAGTGAVSIDLDDKLGRFVYAPPLNHQPIRIGFKVTDSTGQSANAAYIDIILTDYVVATSTFNFDVDSWTVVQGSTVAPSHSATSSGLLNHYIYHADDSLALNANNFVRWAFVAPARYYTNPNPAAMYGGSLSFSMAAFAGDFSSSLSLYSNPKNFVTLSCQTCNSGKGITVAQRNVVYDGSLTSFSFPLTEANWLKDPIDTTVTSWSSPSACEMVQLLAGLSSISIFGDFTTGYEAIGFDSFTITAPSTDTIPTACYASPYIP